MKKSRSELITWARGKYPAGYWFTASRASAEHPKQAGYMTVKNVHRILWDAFVADETKTIEYRERVHAGNGSTIKEFRFLDKPKELTVQDLKDLKTVEQFQAEAHRNAKEKGWWENDMPFPQFIALLHSEASEAFEEYRAGRGIKETYFRQSGVEADPKKPEGIPVELADLVIRVLDYCGANDIDLAEAMRLKMAYNRTRPYRHGGKVA